MAQVSKYKLSKRDEDKLRQTVGFVLTSLGTEEEMKVFLSAFLTPTEEIMLAKRLAMIILIKEGLSDTQIATTLHVTRVTVTKMRYFYEARGRGFDIAIKKLKEKDQLEQTKKFLFALARHSIKAAGGRIDLGILK